MKLHEIKPALRAPNARTKARRQRHRVAATERPPPEAIKGQWARSGGGVRPGFEGGQMPLTRRLAQDAVLPISLPRSTLSVNVGDLELSSKMEPWSRAEIA